MAVDFTVLIWWQGRAETYFTNNLSILKLEGFCFYSKTASYWFYVRFEILVSVLGIRWWQKASAPWHPRSEKKSFRRFNPVSYRFFGGDYRNSDHIKHKINDGYRPPLETIPWFIVYKFCVTHSVNFENLIYFNWHFLKSLFFAA